ncbi:MAG TPA: hypothetical protein VFW52_02760 [Candidatus Saccharimonadales bacterium]|nr:hypothetical protein [Candidatus Saccharimonadales bacterium]
MEKQRSSTPNIEPDDIARLIEEMDRRDDELARQAVIFDHATDDVRAEMLRDPAFENFISHREAQQSIIDARAQAYEDAGHFYISSRE